MTPFRDILVFPSYSKGRAVVSWSVDASWRDAEFYVYRKSDGGQKWELLNREPVFGTTYTDMDFKSGRLTDVPWYRVTAMLGNASADSEPVALYDRTGRKAFGAAFKILSLKYRQARADGIPVLYYPAVANGKMSDMLDPSTGQRTASWCSSDSDESGTADTGVQDDYGTYYAGGYCPPFLTFVRFIGAKNVKENILDEGNYQEEVQYVEFLPFPPVRTNDLIVDPATDRRWLVNKSIRPQAVKGIIPIGYFANMTLLQRTHAAYRVPLPGNWLEMVRSAQPMVL